MKIKTEKRKIMIPFEVSIQVDNLEPKILNQKVHIYSYANMVNQELYFEEISKIIQKELKNMVDERVDFYKKTEGEPMNIIID
jgi:hypothetical protein